VRFFKSSLGFRICFRRSVDFIVKIIDTERIMTWLRGSGGELNIINRCSGGSKLFYDFLTLCCFFIGWRRILCCGCFIFAAADILAVAASMLDIREGFLFLLVSALLSMQESRLKRIIFPKPSFIFFFELLFSFLIHFIFDSC